MCAAVLCRPLAGSAAGGLPAPSGHRPPSLEQRACHRRPRAGLSRRSQAGAGPYDLTVRFRARSMHADQIVDQLFTPPALPVCSPTPAGARPLRRPGPALAGPDPRFHRSRTRRSARLGDLAGTGRSRRPGGTGPGASYFEDGPLAVASAMASHGVAPLARPLISADVAAGRLAIPFPNRFLRATPTSRPPPPPARRPTVLALRTPGCPGGGRAGRRMPHKSAGPGRDLFRKPTA